MNLEQIANIANKHPEIVGVPAGLAGGAALTWFANKFLEKKNRISLVNGILLGSIAGRTGAAAYRLMKEYGKEKSAAAQGSASTRLGRNVASAVKTTAKPVVANTGWNSKWKPPEYYPKAFYSFSPKDKRRWGMEVADRIAREERLRMLKEEYGNGLIPIEENRKAFTGDPVSDKAWARALVDEYGDKPMPIDEVRKTYVWNRSRKKK